MKKQCKNCKYCEIVYTSSGWSFPGCYKDPYRGKWTAEIKPEECPGAEIIEPPKIEDKDWWLW